MEPSIVLKQSTFSKSQRIVPHDENIPDVTFVQPGTIGKKIIWWRIKLRIFYFALTRHTLAPIL